MTCAFRNLALATILVLAHLASAPSVQAQTPALFADDNAQDLELGGSVLFWTSTTGCLGFELRPVCVIRSQPSAGGGRRTLFDNSVGPEDRHIRSNLAVGRHSIYWISAGGGVFSLPRNAVGGDAPSQIADKETVDSSSEIATDATHVYWTENVGATGKLFRAAIGGGAREPVVDWDRSTLTQLRADGDGGVFYLAELPFAGAVLHRATVGASGTDIETSAGFVHSYAFDETHVYATWGTSPIRLGSAPRTALDTFGIRMTLYSIPRAGDPETHGLTVAGRNLYWHETRSSSGPLFRFPKGFPPAAGASPSAITEARGYVHDLISTGRHLFWIDRQRIYRLPVDAAAVNLDLRADEVGLEVVQVIQSASHDVPLVSDKATFVRFYGRIGSSSAGRTSLLAPSAVLIGVRDGGVLPGSPLLPLSMQPVLSRPVDRTSLVGSFLFQLPPTWTEAGVITLTGILNPRRILAETDWSNNESERGVRFRVTQGVCVDILPVLTTNGVSVAARTSGVGLHFARALSLLPLSTLSSVLRGGDARRKPLTGEPYEMAENDDQEELLTHLIFEFMFNDPPPHCGGNRTIRAVMVPAASRFGMSSNLAPIIYFLASFAGGPMNFPYGGVAGLAHELAHQLGRAHVFCPMAGPNAPPNPDPGYPYPPCFLDTANNHIGFDPISRGLIVPQPGAGGPPSDYMSYSTQLLWTSDYIYRAILAAVDRSRAREAFREPPPSADPLLLIGGIAAVEEGSASIGFAYEATGDTLRQIAAKLAASGEVSSAYEIRLYGQAGGLLSKHHPYVGDIETESRRRAQLFAALVDASPAAARVELVSAAGAVLATRAAGVSSPTVGITRPTAGSAVGREMEVAWSGRDADGDRILYQLRYSSDNGATWSSLAGATAATSLKVDMEMFPGGEECLVQVIASDGLHSSTATAGPFEVAVHAPQVGILDRDYAELSGDLTASAAQSETLVLRGHGYDAEDGELEGPALRWQLTGPIARVVEGAVLMLTEAPPGGYDLRLSGTDRDGMVGEAATKVTIFPKRIFDGPPPTLDGYCDDAAYDVDVDPVTLRYADLSLAQARFVHGDGAVFACFSGLPLASDATEAVSLKLDVDNSGTELQGPDDLSFVVRKDGLLQTGRGDGAGGEVLDRVPQGLAAAVSADDVSWQAEMRIEERLLSGWGRLVRMRTAHTWRIGGGESGWPVESTGSSPASWGLTALGRLAQSITFEPLPDRVVGAPDFTLTASTSSGLPVSFSSLTTGVCATSAATVTLVSPGTCTIRGSQSGNTVFLPAENVDRSFEVAPRARRFALSVRAGLALPHGSSFDNGLSVSLGLEYLVAPQFSIEGVLGFHALDHSAAGPDLEILQASLNARWFRPTSTGLRPFVNGGLGVYAFDPGNTEIGVNVGLGVDYELRPDLSLEVAYNYHVVDPGSASFDLSSVQVGLRWQF